MEPSYVANEIGFAGVIAGPLAPSQEVTSVLARLGGWPRDGPPA